MTIFNNKRTDFNFLYFYLSDCHILKCLPNSHWARESFCIDFLGLFRFFPPALLTKLLFPPLADMLSWAVWFKFLLNKVIANTCLFRSPPFFRMCRLFKLLEDTVPKRSIFCKGIVNFDLPTIFFKLIKHHNLLGCSSPAMEVCKYFYKTLRKRSDQVMQIFAFLFLTKWTSGFALKCWLRSILKMFISETNCSLLAIGCSVESLLNFIYQIIDAWSNLYHRLLRTFFRSFQNWHDFLDLDQREGVSEALT